MLIPSLVLFSGDLQGSECHIIERLLRDILSTQSESCCCQRVRVAISAGGKTHQRSFRMSFVCECGGMSDSRQISRLSVV